MWRRLVFSSHLKTLASTRSMIRFVTTTYKSLISPHPSASLFTRYFSSQSTNTSVKRVEDVMPMATGHKREELEVELQGKKVIDIDNPEGPLGTKEAPAVIKSYKSCEEKNQAT